MNVIDGWHLRISEAYRLHRSPLQASKGQSGDLNLHAPPSKT